MFFLLLLSLSEMFVFQVSGQPSEFEYDNRQWTITTMGIPIPYPLPCMPAIRLSSIHHYDATAVETGEMRTFCKRLDGVFEELPPEHISWMATITIPKRENDTPITGLCASKTLKKEKPKVLCVSRPCVHFEPGSIQDMAEEIGRHTSLRNVNHWAGNIMHHVVQQHPSQLEELKTTSISFTHDSIALRDANPDFLKGFLMGVWTYFPKSAIRTLQNNELGDPNDEFAQKSIEHMFRINKPPPK